MTAHINDKDEEQTVFMHVEAVAEIARNNAKFRGLSDTMFLTGLLHDVGKETKAFEQYIHKAHENPKSVHRGEVNHSSAGGKYIYERYGEGYRSA